MVSPTLPGGERGQLLLVGAAAIALVIVGSVVLLNGLKFTDTVGTEGNFDTTDEAHRTAETARRDLSKLADRVRSDTGLVGFETAIRQNISIYSNRLSNATFTDSATFVNVSLNESASRDGPLVTQNVSDSADFRNENALWKTGTPPFDQFRVAGNASTLGPFNLTVTRFPCDRGTGLSDTNLTVAVENATSGNTWEMRLARDTDGASCSTNQGTRYIEVYNRSGAKVQSLSSDSTSGFPGVGNGQVEIDLIAGDINGRAVDLRFAEGIDPKYNVTFDNNRGLNDEYGQGAYRVGSDGVFPQSSDDSSPDPPGVQIRMQRPALTFVYERPGVKYNTTVVEEGGA